MSGILPTHSIDSMANDLSSDHDKPLWPLSSYGPAKFVPTVIGGLDESPEELRVKAVQALKAGTTSEYVSFTTTSCDCVMRSYADFFRRSTKPTRHRWRTSRWLRRDPTYSSCTTKQ